MSDNGYPELTKLGYSLLGFAIISGAIYLRWQSVNKTEPPPIVEAPVTVLPDMAEAVVDPEVMREAIDHMRHEVNKFSGKRKRKKTSDHPDIPGMQFLGTETPNRHFIPAD